MKHLLFISALLVVLFSCKKEITQEINGTSLLNNVKHQLKDSLSLNDFQQLDFINSVITEYPKKDLLFLRIPFINKDIENDFIILKIEKNQSFSGGKIINLLKSKEGTAAKKPLKFNGKIQIFSLKRNLLIESLITNGYVEAFHSNQNNTALKEDIAEVPLMPEVILIASYPPSGLTYSNWYNIQSLFYDYGTGSTGTSGGGGGGGYYSNSYPADYYGGNGGGGAPYVEEPILIDFEPVENLTAIDIAKYLKCFSNIPDLGATCSIRILTDLPVDKDPNAFFNWGNRSPGHTFLQISKINGSQSVQQNIGFYPIKGWKNVLTTAPEDGKFVDNSDHEFNASLTMNLTPDDLQSTLVHMLYLANFIKYDIDEYNCTDFALEVFNYKRGGNQLTIPMYNIPGGTALNGTATPQGLYQKLTAMKALSNAESQHIIIPGEKGFVGNSNGTCN